jgi:hypothetical protein
MMRVNLFSRRRLRSSYRNVQADFFLALIGESDDCDDAYSDDYYCRRSLRRMKRIVE